MRQEQNALGPYRETAMLKKWNDRPQEGEPDEIIQRTWYYEADHTEVTDPQRIEEIEQHINRQKE